VIGEIAALGASCSWAVGSHLFGRLSGRGDVSPGTLNLGKCFSAAAMFGVVSLLLRGLALPAVPAREAGWLAVSGVIGLALGDGAYFQALASLGVRRALLLLSTAPVFAAIGGALLLHEPLGLRDGAAILMVVAGVALVVQEQEAVAADRAPHRLTLAGLFFGLMAGLGQAAGSLMSRTAMASGVTALDAALVRLPAGLVGIVLLSALSGRLRGHVQALRRPRLFAAVAGSASVGSFVGIWLSQLAIGRSSSTAVASTLLATSPIFALPLGKWMSAERITARALGGTAVACAGLGLLTLGLK
jgi:drug/metabolite transporter (DMT)-like permease